ncbi:protein of unknown function [Kyrpidia spormannii]|uniref:Uncharacterized protein n=1 Tax=Kyrpidia spormannii TaxID=2055160 RepID=A0A6F9E0P1_9BACL|nr:protein of unknown function [Kyrpidia spormannii]
MSELFSLAPTRFDTLLAPACPIMTLL